MSIFGNCFYQASNMIGASGSVYPRKSKHLTNFFVVNSSQVTYMNKFLQ